MKIAVLDLLSSLSFAINIFLISFLFDVARDVNIFRALRDPKENHTLTEESARVLRHFTANWIIPSDNYCL